VTVFSHVLGHGTAVRREGSVVASSSGIVIGCAQVVSHGRQSVPEHAIDQHQIEAEIDRLRAAIEAAALAIDVEREHLQEAGIKEPMILLDMHRMLVSDPELREKSSRRIRNDRICAEWALRQEVDAIRHIFEEIDDEYLSNRKHDIEHAGRRIINSLLCVPSQEDAESASGATELQPPIVYVSDDFSVTEVVNLWRRGAAGIITEQGGVDAHNIIVARGIGLPALVGATGILADIESGSPVILDAEQDMWILNPPPTEQLAYQHFLEAVSISKKGLESFAHQDSLSANQHAMKLMANIEFIEELDMADQVGMDGIGLYRSEFLFINESRMPDEQYQFEQYVRFVRRMHGKPVTMRLLDVGGDRPWLYSDLQGHDYSGANPALGLRGLRLLLRNPEGLKIQLSAMIRAAEEGSVRILAPMVTTCEEMEQLRDIVEQCQIRLGSNQHIPLGAMIEVPAAALIADQMATVSDFFSIGTNDLMQYTLAADRNDEEVAGLFQSDHAAILQLIQMTAAAAKKANIPVSVCGEMAANPDWTETFLNLDMEYLSMSASSILSIRRFLSRLTYCPIL